jgi:hypothetical protein
MLLRKVMEAEAVVDVVAIVVVADHPILYENGKVFDEEQSAAARRVEHDLVGDVGEDQTPEEY